MSEVLKCAKKVPNQKQIEILTTPTLSPQGVHTELCLWLFKLVTAC